MPIADGAGQRWSIGVAGELALVQEQEVIAVGVCFDEIHFSQKASKCQPNRRTNDRGSALNVPTKNVLNTSPFQPP